MADATHAREPRTDPMTPPNAARWTCWIFGAIFIIIAIWGFITGDQVLGVFSVNTAHNWVHLLSGIVLGAMGFATEPAARATLWVFAVIYAIVMILGFFAVEWLVDWLDLNVADNWLHLLLTAAFVIGALVSHAQARARERVPGTVPPPRT